MLHKTYKHEFLDMARIVTKAYKKTDALPEVVDANSLHKANITPPDIRVFNRHIRTIQGKIERELLLRYRDEMQQLAVTQTDPIEKRKHEILALIAHSAAIITLEKLPDQIKRDVKELDIKTQEDKSRQARPAPLPLKLSGYGKMVSKFGEPPHHIMQSMEISHYFDVRRDYAANPLLVDNFSGNEIEQDIVRRYYHLDNKKGKGISDIAKAVNTSTEIVRNTILDFQRFVSKKKRKI